MYNIREKSLVKLLGRVLGLPIARRKSLEEWCRPGRGDLGACVERVQKEAVCRVARYVVEPRLT